MRKITIILICLFPLINSAQDFKLRTTVRINPSGFYDMTYSNNYSFGVTGGIMNNAVDVNGCDQLNFNYPISVRNNPINQFPPNSTTFSCILDWNGPLPTNTFVGFVFPTGITATNPNTGFTIPDFSSDGTSHSVAPSTVFEPCRTYIANDSNANPDLTDISLFFVPTNERIAESIPSFQLTIDDVFQFELESGNPASAWEYSLNTTMEITNGTATWVRFPNIPRSLQDLGLTENDIINGIITFRGIACGNINVLTENNSNPISFIRSSVELNRIEHEDAQCFGENNGSVTLYFEDNVDEVNGFEMRYYIYQGDPSSFPSDELLNTNPTDPSDFPQVIADPRFSNGPNLNQLGSLTGNPDGTFSGTYTGLGEGDYYVLYQEVNYSNPVQVKSGRLTQGFTINQPSQVTLNTNATNFFTDTSCGTPAIFELNNTASGGNNLDSSGTYSYEYSFDDINFVSVGATNRLEIPATSSTQDIWVRGVYTTATGVCAGTSYPYEISPATPPITFTNPTTVNASTTTAPDGSVRIEFSGGSTPYAYELLPNTGAPPVPVNLGGGNFAVTYNNLPAGSYTVSVAYTENTSNCSAQSPELVVGTDPIPSLGTPQTTQIPCIGETGRIEVPISGFTGGYRYQWEINGTRNAIQLGTDASIILENITTAGEYILRVSNSRVSDTDFNDNNNVGSIPITITSPEPVTLSASATPVSCFNGNDGSITLTLSGGTSYEYTLVMNPEPTDWVALTGNTISNLTPDTYNLRVRNQNGCISNEITATVGNSTPINIVEDVSDVSFDSGNDGAITITVSGGTGNYSFVWSGPAGFTSTNQNVTGLITGLYAVTVTDTNNCTSTVTGIFVPQPDRLDFIPNSPVTTPESCFEADDGSILVQVQGSLEVTYQWFAVDEFNNETFVGEASNSENELNISPLAAGSYRVSIQDNEVGPLFSQILEVEEPLEITADVITTPSCFNANTGTITILNVQGGTLSPSSNYSFSLDGINFQPGNTFESLGEGTYTAFIRETNTLCTTALSVGIGASPEITYNAVASTINNVSQTGAADGSISPVFDGGLGDLNFSWEGPNVGGITNQNITNLGPGTYTITATDENGCSVSESFEITEPGPLTISDIVEQDVSCFNANDGAIFTTVVGEAPITYTWTQVGVGVLTTTAEDDIANLPPGTYTLTIEDASTTPPLTSREITIIEPDILLAEAFSTDVSCADIDDGIILVNASQGTPGYEYSIDNGISYQTSNTFSGLGAGTYTISVRDANQCTVDVFATIGAPLPIGIEINTQQPLSAANAADGIIDITAFGGTGDLTYSWTGPTGFTTVDSNRLENLPGGDYQVTITDANYNPANPTACSFTSAIITIAEPGELLVSLEQTVFLECNGNTFAEIIANVQGGVPTYTYEWFQRSGNSTTALAETSEIINNLGAGTYFVVVTDANGITVTSADLAVTEPDLLLVELDNTTDILCAGEATGAISVSVTGGTAPYSYNWSNGAETADLSTIPAGEYNLLVTDNNGCFTELEVTVNAPDNPLEITSAVITDLTDYQSNDGQIEIAIEGGTEPYNVSWTSDLSGTINSTALVLDALAADTYTATIVDANGCSITERYEVNQPDIIEETITPPSCNGTTDGSISVLVNQGNGNFTYLWNTGATTNSIVNVPAGTYTVTITGFETGPEVRTYTMENPVALDLELGDAITLCQDQDAFFDITIADENATYTWQSENGFASTEPQVLLTTSGTYTASIETPSGCFISDSVVIEATPDEIDAEFAMSSQIFTGETLILVDISFPLPDTIQWLLPEQATVIQEDNDSAEISFETAGEYEISLVTTKGNCQAIQTKRVLVLERDALIDSDGNTPNDTNKQIEDFIVYPNPSSGVFTADVQLSERGSISIKVFSFSNNLTMADERRQGDSSYEIPFDLSSMPSGVYAVVLETPYGSSLRKVIMR